VSVRAHRDAEGPRETEVGKLESAIAVDEQVLRLEVAVENAPTMTKEEAIQ